MDMLRVTARWTGFSGAPGYSNFFFSSGFVDGGLLGDEAQSLADRVAASFDAMSQLLPRSVSVTVEPEVPVIDSDTGMAQSYNTITPPEAVSGEGTDNEYASPAGAVVTWRTDDLRNGRRIRGRTFLVPIRAYAYESDGTLRDSTLTHLRNFADTMLGGELDGDLGVWSRPVGGSGGVFATVTGYTVPDMVAILRSRRD